MINVQIYPTKPAAGKELTAPDMLLFVGGHKEAPKDVSEPV